MNALAAPFAFRPPRWLSLLLALALWLALALAASAQAPQAIPALTARVIDQTGTLTAEQASALEASLAALEQERGAQVAVLIVPTTAPEDIAAYANRVASAWKLRRKDVGDGALIIVALRERKMRIEVARTLKGALLYLNTELEIMLHDIEQAKELGVDGVVFGCLTADGNINMKAM